MFKHILIPTDGSELSLGAAMKAVQLARVLGAHITAVTVSVPWRTIAVGEVAMVLSEKDYEMRTTATARQSLGAVTDAAKAAGVVVNAIHVSEPRPYLAIIETAEKQHCDLIAMASHGYTGLDRLFLGSQTNRTLTHSKIPVLVIKS